MKGATRITRTTQKTEEKPTIVSRRTRIETSSQNRPSGQTSSYTTTQKTTTTINKQNDSPYKITIKTIYEKGRTNENTKLKEKPDSQNKSHFHKLSGEERKRFNRGIRPSAAQREADEFAKMSQGQKDGMIEIVDKTDYSNNPNIKLKPNKKVLINRKKENKDNNENGVDKQKFSRGLRTKEAEKERQELAKKENQYGRRNVEIITKEVNRGTKPNIIITGSSQSNATQIVNTNQVNNRRNNNQPNKDIQLIPNKKTVIRNPKSQSQAPIPKPTSFRNYSKPVENKDINNPDSNKEKKGFRNNTVSHSIIENRKQERKPYVLNERKTDVISFNPRAFQRYNAVGDKNEPYKGNNNHNYIETKNIDEKKAQRKYNMSHDPNFKNTLSHKIDATKKEPKKEVVVQPRKLTVIRSVIPNRIRNVTEVNDNTSKKYSQNFSSRKVQTDKKVPTTNLAQKIANVRDYRNNQQTYQPRINKINNNEPKKEITNTYSSRYNKPQPQPQQKPQIPTNQYSRKTYDIPKKTNDYTKPNDNKYPLQQKTYTSNYTRTKVQNQPQSQKQTQAQPPKPNQYIIPSRTQIQTNKYTPSNTKETKDTNIYSRRNQPQSQTQPQTQIKLNNKPVTIVNKRRQNNLDNNDVKQVVYKKDKNETNVNKEKPKNYVVSNVGFAQNTNNNGFVISRANESYKPTAINYNINKTNNENKQKIDNKINIETKPKEKEITIKQEIKPEPKEEKQENKEEKIEEVHVEPEHEEIEQKEENEQKIEQNIEIQNEEPPKAEEQIEIQKVEEPKIEQEIKVENNEQNEQPENEYEENENQNEELNNIEQQKENIPEEKEKVEVKETYEIKIEKKEDQVNEENNNQDQEHEPEQIEQNAQIEQNQNMLSKEGNENNMEQEYVEMNQNEGEEGEEAMEGQEGEEQFENPEGYENYEEQNIEVEGEAEGEGEEEQYENMEEYEDNEGVEDGENNEEEMGEEEIQEIDGGGEEEEEVEGENEDYGENEEQ